MNKAVRLEYEPPSTEVLKVDVDAVIALSAGYEGFGREDDLSGE